MVDPATASKDVTVMEHLHYNTEANSATADSRTTLRPTTPSDRLITTYILVLCCMPVSFVSL